MEKQFDEHGNPKRVLLPASKVSKPYWQQKDEMPALRAKVLKAYFKIVKQSVLQGHEWTFPDGSTLCVKWERKVGAHGISRRRRGADGYKERVYNPRRLNQQYCIEMKGPTMQRYRYRYESSGVMRTALSVILFNTDRQYRIK